MSSRLPALPQASRVGRLLLGCALACLGNGGLRAAEPIPSRPPANLMEMSLDELLTVKVQTVTSAAKYEQPTALAPASVTIVTDRDIQLNGFRNLAEVLGSVRGFYSTYDRNYHYLGIRGFNRPGDYNSRVLLLIDGHRVNDVVFDGAPLGNDGYLDVDLIDRIEVVRGPGSAVYGSSALFGVVNVITRQGRDLNGAEAAFTAGALDTYQGRFSFGRQLTNGVEFLLSGTVRETDGQPRINFPGAGTAVGLDGESGRSLFAKLGCAGVELAGGFETRTKQIPTAAERADRGTAVWASRPNQHAGRVRSPSGFGVPVQRFSPAAPPGSASSCSSSSPPPPPARKPPRRKTRSRPRASPNSPNTSNGPPPRSPTPTSPSSSASSARTPSARSSTRACTRSRRPAAPCRPAGCATSRKPAAAISST